MNQIKTETAYRVEYYDSHDKRWYIGGIYSQQTTAFNVFLRYKNSGRTCRVTKVESTIEIMEQYRRKPRKEGVSDESD